MKNILLGIILIALVIFGVIFILQQKDLLALGFKFPLTATSCIRANPDISITPVTDSGRMQENSYAIYIKNNDTDNCDTGRFIISSSLKDTDSPESEVRSVTIDPSASTVFVTHTPSPEMVPRGKYVIVYTAVNIDDITKQGTSNELIYTVSN